MGRDPVGRMTRAWAADALAAATAAVGAAAATRALRRRPPGGPDRWTRTNHAGNPISLLEGPGYVAGALAGSALGSGLAPGGLAPAVAAAGAGAAGLLDDLAGDASSKGLRGHLGALREGRVTTGLVKIGALCASGLAAAYALDRRVDLDTVVGGAVIAGSANLANLLDLRPGRTLKAVLLAAAPVLLTGPDRAAAVAAGAAIGTIRGDLAGATMLGDAGANPAGALIGTALVARSGRGGRLVALAVLAGLTLASEKVSFSSVIAGTPGLRELDAWGRE